MSLFDVGCIHGEFCDFQAHQSCPVHRRVDLLFWCSVVEFVMQIPENAQHNLSVL